MPAIRSQPVVVDRPAQTRIETETKPFIEITALYLSEVDAGSRLRFFTERVMIGVMQRAEPHLDAAGQVFEQLQRVLDEPAGIELPVVLQMKDVRRPDKGVGVVDRRDLTDS